MQQVNLNLVPGGVNPIVYASQNDDKRTIRFELVSGGDNDVYVLSGNETITAKITKPDGTAITIPITNPGSGKHYVDLVNGVSDYDQDGVYLGEVSITKGEKVLGTGNFVLKVEADPYDGSVQKKIVIDNPATFSTSLPDVLVSCKCKIDDANGIDSMDVINAGPTYARDSVPYQLRQTPITANRTLEKLIGVSCAFNQLVNSGDTSINTISGHKYVTKINNVWLIIAGGSAVTIVDDSSDMVIDLTAMFGSEVADYFYNLEQNTAGSGIALFRQLFPEDYYAYQTATLISSKPVSKVVVGVNLFSNIFSEYRKPVNYYIKNIPLTVGKRYTLKATLSGTAVSGCVVGIAKDGDSYPFTGPYNLINSDGTINTISSILIDETWTNPKLMIYASSEAIFNSLFVNYDILLVEGTDTTYHAYEEHTYPLGGDELRGLLKVENGQLVAYGDVHPSDGNGTEVFDIVDLGTLDYTYYTSGTNPIFYGSVSGSKIYSANVMPSAICDTYSFISVQNRTNLTENLKNGECSFIIEGTNFAIRNDSYTDAATFKTAMSGVYLIYEKATPTAKSYTPFTNPMLCGSTEEFTDSRSVKMFCGHDSVYADNISFAHIVFGQTVTDGTLDVVHGILTPTGGSPVSVTPASIQTFSGVNNVFSNGGGDITAIYLDVL